jgi:hypothetical protein
MRVNKLIYAYISAAQYNYIRDHFTVNGGFEISCTEFVSRARDSLTKNIIDYGSNIYTHWDHLYAPIRITVITSHASIRQSDRIATLIIRIGPYVMLLYLDSHRNSVVFNWAPEIMRDSYPWMKEFLEKYLIELYKFITEPVTVPTWRH